MVEGLTRGVLGVKLFGMKLKILSLLLAVLTPALALAANLKVTTAPANATVQLDGVAYGSAPLTIPNVSPGTHELKVSSEGYTPRSDSVQVGGDEDLEIHAPLNLAPKLVLTPPPAPQPPPQPQQLTPPPAPYPQGYSAPTPQQQSWPPPPPPAQAATPPPPAQPPAPFVAPRDPNSPQIIRGTHSSQPFAPLPVSELPVGWGTQKKSVTLRVDTNPPNATVQVVGMGEVRQAPTIFTGFSAGTVRLKVRANGYREKEVAVDLLGDSRTLVTLDPM